MGVVRGVWAARTVWVGAAGRASHVRVLVRRVMHLPAASCSSALSVRTPGTPEAGSGVAPGRTDICRHQPPGLHVQGGLAAQIAVGGDLEKIKGRDHRSAGEE